jgi:nucleoside-diphosphate-sugar epimerase
VDLSRAFVSREILPIVVTGGGGFVGARLVRRLAGEGRSPHVLLRSTTDPWRLAGLEGRIRTHVCDLGDAKAVAAAIHAIRPRTVFHVAATGAYHAGDPGELFADNVLATFHLLEATAGVPDCRVVYTCSSLEPGPRPVPIRESDPFRPHTPYGVVKAASTLLARQAAGQGRPIVMLRPFAVYGPGEPAKRLIPTAIRAALDGTPLRLTAPGFTRDFVFVEDVVDAYVAAAHAPGIDGELVNIGTGRATPNEEVVRLVASVVGRPIALHPEPFPARATDTAVWCADITKARDLLGWSPAHTLEQGLVRAVAWLREERLVH